MKNGKGLLLGALVVILMGGLAFAQLGNRDRDLGGRTANLDTIGTCDPESDTTAVGWDTDPTSGSWGGKPESQFAVAWEPGFMDVPANDGRFAECTIPGVTGKTPKKITLNVLEGLANDDYCVFASVAAGDLLIGCVNETSLSEVWVDKDFTLPGGAFASGQDVTVKILVTGNAWASFSTWGQLAVDSIEILGD
jgi:hypothetical protein